MNFEMPMAAAALDNELAKQDTNGKSWDHIGEPLNPGVDHKMPDYDAKLELNLQPKPGVKRQEICEVCWGKIFKDGARLTGLGSAMENIAMVIKKGKDQLAHDWKGESFDSFRSSIEKVEQLLTQYAEAAKVTGTSLQHAATRIAIMFGAYRDTSVEILKFSGMDPAEKWRKLNGGTDGQFFTDHCTSCGNGSTWGNGGWRDCEYNDDDNTPLIDGKHITQRLYDQLGSWDCCHEDSLVESQYNDIVKWGQGEKDAIARKINEWYSATDTLKKNVSLLYDAALDNLRYMAERKVFAHMQTPGASAATTSTSSTGGDGHKGGDGRTSTGGNNDTGGGNPGSDYKPPPLPKPGDLDGDGKPDSPGDQNMDGKPDNPGDRDMDGKPDNPLDKDGDGKPDNPNDLDGDGRPDNQVDTDGDGKPDSLVKDAGTPETVKITEGDRTIEVASPDGEGRVKVTVDDGSGTPKTYDLDFATASALADGSTGLGPDGQPVPVGTDGRPAASFGPDGVPMSPQAGAEHVQAGPDGKAVIHDGPLTITAERPPGSPDTVVVTVDDGSGKPTSYTLDYAENADQGASPVASGSVQANAANGDGASASSRPAHDGVVAGAAAEGRPVSSGPADGQGQAGASATAAESVQATSAQSSADTGASWSDTGSNASDQTGAHQGDAALSGEAALSSAADGSGAPDDRGQNAQPAAQSGGMMGGGMPMGGGGAAGGGGDQVRSQSSWSIVGTLFDDNDTFADTEARLSGVRDV